MSDSRPNSRPSSWPDHCRYAVLRTSPQLESFWASWNVLWRRDPRANPFQHSSWLLPWWRQFGGSDPRAVIISRAGQPIGLLPFYIHHSPGSRQRRLLLLGAGTTDYLDGLFAPECTPEHAQNAIHLLQQEGGWDALDATQLRPESPLFRALKQEPRAVAFPATRCSRMPAVRVADLPTKIRRNVMYYRNRAARLGTLEFSTAGAADWPTAFQSLVRLHASRWKRKGKPGVLADPCVLAWHREAIPLLQSNGLLRLSTLRLNGEDIAVSYSLADPVSRTHRALYIYITAYSPDHADLRPGSLLLGYAIERAAEEGIETIDMLRGEEPYKKIWHAKPVPTYGFSLPCAAQAQPQAA